MQHDPDFRTVQAPEQIEPHAADYARDAWREYTMIELGNWVSLLTKRAGHRVPGPKRQKDLQDARNYLAMMEAHVRHVETDGA